MSFERADVQSAGKSWDFTTTHWNVVLAAGANSEPRSTATLEILCRAYWYPLYAYVRRQGRGPEEARDLTQEFFLRLLEKNSLRLADPNRGRFRSFLLTSLKHFLVNEWDKSRTIRRGGGEAELSLQVQDAEGRYLTEPADDLTPERLYDQRWAVALVENVLARLRDEYVAANKADLFDGIKGHVWGEKVEGYAELAGRLQTSEGALRIAAHRIRERFRELLRQEVAHTVATPEDIDAELRHLVSLLRD